MKPEKEIRQINTSAKVEVREDGTMGSIYGYPIVYNKDSEDMGFVERIAPGAAKNALKRSDIRGLKNHDPSLIFGRQGVNLTFTEDKNGLRYDATPLDTRNYREIAEEVRTGLLTGQSFGFTVLADEWTDLDTDHPKRTITEIGELFDVGPVTYPAYQDTTVALRSLDAAKEKPEETGGFKATNITVTVRDKWTEKEKTFDFSGDDRFDRAAEKIKNLSSDAKPTLPESDTTVPDPTIKKEPEETRDDTLDRINETIARLKK